ncbi:MAG: glycosyltransferase [Bacteroidota bacterium]|nr:glycosyltransferase [Bacteroidota bacterium]
MKVSVLMPVYNAGIYLHDSIDSILKQSYTDFEFLIINDGSSDDSEKIIKSYSDPRIRFYTNEINLGLIATLNKGLSLAKGEYIVRQDADDISLLNRLEVQVDFMDKHQDLLMLSSNAIIIDHNSEVTGESDLPSNEIRLRFRMLFKCGIFHTSAIFRKVALQKFNLKYDSAYPHTEDYKLWSELSRHGSIHILDDKLVKYRTHPESISSRNKKQQEEIAAKVVKENVEHIGVDINIQEAERLRGLFRSTGIDRNFLKNDLELLLRIIKNFDAKYREEENYNSFELIDLLKRMTRWISKYDLIKIEFLILFLYIKGILFFNIPINIKRK